MKKILLSVLFSLTVAVCRADGPYHFLQEIPVGGDGGWDYLSVDSAGAAALRFARYRSCGD